MAKRVQPPWSVGVESNPLPALQLYNSLTRKKEVFVPKNGNKVLWYSCGPTVYDAAHMGHARSYLAFDIIRRVLSNYFGYNVLYVMNITDIDDKIIKRARKNYFFDNYIKEVDSKPIKNILEDAKCALEYLISEATATDDKTKQEMIMKLTHDIDLSIRQLETNLKENDKTCVQKSLLDMLLIAKDPLGEILDKKLSSSITDNTIFSALPKYWEEKFFEDMASLNVLRPDVLTRVSEYIPEIIEYIKKIIDNGVAYEASGSVYFNVKAFDSNEKHFYAKLVPEAYGDVRALQDGEGELTKFIDKKDINDFALWKSSKPGEPSWESPWGPGRPGWHIECSVMATEICGDSLDIHTGGQDLKFPHHDNEIAQAEAYFGTDTWVRYFLHSGHLTISGCKMSKSLKNFITIADALKSYTPRQIRYAFLLHSWRDTLDYSTNTMDSALSYEKMCMEFFLNVKDLLHCSNNSNYTSQFKKWTDPEKNLCNIFLETKGNVHSALCDNIDTRTALDQIKECITQCNIYLKGNDLNALLIKDIALFITHIFKIFGIIHEEAKIGFLSKEVHNLDNIEAVLMPYLKVFAEFRDEVRLKAKDSQNKEILISCDNLRDNKLIDLGIRLEDREGKSSAIKLVDKETLLKEKEMKDRLKLEKEQLKAKNLALLAEKEALKKKHPKEMFLDMTDKYSAFDEELYEMDC